MTAPSITIRPSVPDAFGRALVLTSPLVPAPLTVELQPADVIRERSAILGRAIGHVTEEFRWRRAAPPAAAARLLTGMAAAARIFLWYVLRDPHQVDELMSFIRLACPAVRNPTAPPPVIHVVVDVEDYFPWELLPLFPAQRSTADAEDPAAIDIACRTFTGFSAIVERRHVRWRPGRDFLDGWGGLPVRVIYNAKYEGAIAELSYLRARSHLRLEGPYPRCVLDAEAPDLARQLCDPSIGLDGNERPFADEIVHISCHCNAQPGSASDDFGLWLGDDCHEEEMCVRLAELGEQMMRHWMNGAATEPADMPFVFLNACGTTALDPASAASFLRPFYANRNRSIVATSANVTDRLAADVSRWFYAALFRGATVGEALHGARWRLLEDRGNPLGLLYSLHNFAGLRVLPVPSEPEEL